ncbi:yqaJ-like viral recombinase domain-containing protein [Phthorimaea operculella]|nr:yqaJ-like viral recombinase domain-containing protein [Phthorimaea operculella]
MSNKSSYKKRQYAGKVNRKRVAAQLKRHHGSKANSVVTRASVWLQPNMSQLAEREKTEEEEEVSDLETSGLFHHQSESDPCISGGPSTSKRCKRSDSIHSEVDQQSFPPPPDFSQSNEQSNSKNSESDRFQSCTKTYARLKPRYLKEASYTTTTTSETPTTTEKNKTCNVNWPQPDPSVESHVLQVEVEPLRDNFLGLDGYRIVDIKHVLQWAFVIARHKDACTCANIVFEKEQKQGLQSTFLFKCTTCGREWKESSEKTHGSTINKSFVWGTVTSGSYFSQTEHLMGIMDIPTMNAATFHKMEEQLGVIWIEHLTEEIEKAGEMERAIAIEKGNVDEDGVPFVPVCVDGGWPKRTYGHNYNSASGMACIIGQETKKCLFLGIKNKYCFHCQHYEKKGKDIPPHKCFKNFTGALYKILSNTKLPLGGRNMLKPKVSKLTVVSRKIIMHNAGNPNNMRKDLKNGPLHVFGKHDDCSDYYCKFKKSPVSPEEEQAHDVDLVEKMKKEQTTVWALILAANEAVMSKAARLTNATTNIAENFMSVINKFNCGKRINLCKGGSYQRRVQIAGLYQTAGYRWHTAAWRKSSPQSPGKHFLTYITRKEKCRIRQKAYTHKRLFIPKSKQPQPDEHYGPSAMDPADEMDATELKRRCLEKLQEFQKSPDEIKAIELATIGQHDNDFYNMQRNDRLTASQFGMICKRRNNTPCHNHVKQILYKSNFSNCDTTYGQQNESVAKTIFAERHGKTVREAGLFIDEEYGFLGASPDGVIENEKAIVEIKTFPSLARSAQDIQTAAREKKKNSALFCSRHSANEQKTSLLLSGARPTSSHKHGKMLLSLLHFTCASHYCFGNPKRRCIHR